MRQLKRLSLGCAAVLLSAVAAFAGTITGAITTPNGSPLKNGTLGFTLAQAGLEIGTGTVVPILSACYTSTDGSIVGIANPLLPPHVSTSTSGGLTPGNYYAQLTAYGTDGHETLAGPEVVISLPSGGSFTLTYADPWPAGYTQGVKAYVATSSGAETLQGSTTGGVMAYAQTTALTNGAAEPVSNSTVCSIAFNDTIIPYSGYKVSLTSSTGGAYPGYPQMWQLNGGLSGTVNVSQGAPLWNGVVIYPQPIMAQPLNHGPQSISGSLGMSGYDIFGVGALGIGTNNPAYPLDIENGVANASGGYLVNGNGGTLHQCLTSDGTAFNTPATCLLLSAVYYQTVQQHGGALTQRPVINFLAPLQAADNPGSGRTDVSIATSGAGTVVPTLTGTIGATVNCASFDGSGGLTPSAAPCPASGHGVVASADFTSCAMVSYGATDQNCVAPATWSNSISGSYSMSCIIGIPFTGGGADTSGLSQTTFGLAGASPKTSTGFTYFIANQHSAAATLTVTMSCVAVQ
jgi:hypothetical protein